MRRGRSTNFKRPTSIQSDRLYSCFCHPPRMADETCDIGACVNFMKKAIIETAVRVGEVVASPQPRVWVVKVVDCHLKN